MYVCMYVCTCMCVWKGRGEHTGATLPFLLCQALYIAVAAPAQWQARLAGNVYFVGSVWDVTEVHGLCNNTLSWNPFLGLRGTGVEIAYLMFPIQNCPLIGYSS